MTLYRHGFALTGVVMIGLIGLWAYWHSSNSAVLPVKTVPVERGTLSTYVEAPGTVVSAQETLISAMTAGQVQDVPVNQGDKVDRGDVLLRLDDRTARSNLKKTEAALIRIREEVSKAARELNVLEELLAVGGAAPQAVDDARSQLRIAKAGVSEAEQDLSLAEREWDTMTIEAPFTGVITSVTAQIGEWATPTTPLFRLADMAQLEIEARVDASDTVSLAIGQQVLVTSDAFPGETWEGKVRQIAPAVERDDNTNTINVRIELAQSYAMRLGEQVDVKIVTVAREKILKLPFGAVIQDEGKRWIAIIEEGRVRLSAVRIGIEDFAYMEIVEGAEQGQRVILHEGKRLQAGDKVREVNPAITP